MTDKPTTILFVCTGNTCRSPMAEGIARKLLAGEPINVFSAGVAAGEGAGATPEAVRAAANHGADIGAHRSIPLTAEMIAGADMIFTMTGAHARAVIASDPGAQNKTRTLDPSGRDIPDPIGCDQSVYDHTADTIAQAIEQRAGLIAGR